MWLKIVSAELARLSARRVIDSANNTLAGIAAAIDSSAAGAKVQATLLSGSTEAPLTIVARNIGTASEMALTQTGGDGTLVTLVNGLVVVLSASYRGFPRCRFRAGTEHRSLGRNTETNALSLSCNACLVHLP